MQDILRTKQDLLSKNEEYYQLRDSSKTLKAVTYDLFNDSKENFLLYTGLRRFETLCSVHDLVKNSYTRKCKLGIEFFSAISVEIEVV